MIGWPGNGHGSMAAVASLIAAMSVLTVSAVTYVTAFTDYHLSGWPLLMQPDFCKGTDAAHHVRQPVPLTSGGGIGMFRGGYTKV